MSSLLCCVCNNVDIGIVLIVQVLQFRIVFVNNGLKEM